MDPRDADGVRTVKRSDVWEETHLLPVRLKMQQEADGSIVVQMPGYRLDTITVTGADRREALARMDERMRAMMGRPSAGPLDMPIDCRLCAHFRIGAGGCTSLVQCVSLDQFKPTPPRQHWTLTPTPSQETTP